ncbi:hypothetical protein [Heyndrickxia acidicola]|uniref:Uncharacterized protein n=1 Tax=Heyndrickxia acidicola TaxID=209389 RepID=A0ABU6MM42_9BACI|nr:hypothetical protein [Heyndrickxia acidicola]MED1204688.1 hypothetical protein [Heyndrickxia acidicola]
MEFAAIVYYILVVLLVLGLPRKIKGWFLGLNGGLVLVFIIGALTIKFRTGYFQDRSRWMNQHGSVVLGSWVLPFFLLFAIALLALIDYRIIRKLGTFDRTGKWVVGIFTVLFDLIYLGGVYMCLYFLSFLFLAH